MNLQEALAATIGTDLPPVFYVQTMLILMALWDCGLLPLILKAWRPKR